MKRVWLILAAFIGLLAGAAPASADIQYTLNQGGSVGPTPFNYGTVNLHQVGSGSTAYITVTVTLSAGEVFLTTGSHSGFTWNLLGSGNPTSITVTSPNAALFDVQGTTAGSYGNSPFGNFEYAIENHNTGGGGGVAGPLVFDIKKTGGLILTDTLFSANAGGYFFASDIGTGCTFSDGHWGCAATGVVASNKRIPEPGTMGMSLTVVAGLAGLVMLQRRRKLARAA